MATLIPQRSLYGQGFSRRSSQPAPPVKQETRPEAEGDAANDSVVQEPLSDMKLTYGPARSRLVADARTGQLINLSA